MANDLQGKRVLLFTSILFDYHIQIKKAIEELGAQVHLYDERNNPSSIEKIFIRKAKFLMSHKTYSYYKTVCEKEIDFNPDYILFVSPEAVTVKALRMLRKRFKNCTFILYLWDSVKNKGIERILNQFDHKLSFDPNDCEKYNMRFRPLFFTKDFDQQMSSGFKTEYEYDISFIGTVHSDRTRILLATKDFCDAQGLNYYFYLFIPGRFLYSLRLIFDKYLRKWDKSYIHLKSIDKKEVLRILSKTRCIIDINHPNQNGLTMRTIEMVGLRRKLATTNTKIVNYDFFRPGNQIVLDRNHLKIDKTMLLREYSDIPDEIYIKYTVQQWAKDIFNLA